MGDVLGSRLHQLLEAEPQGGTAAADATSQDGSIRSATSEAGAGLLGHGEGRGGPALASPMLSRVMTRELSGTMGRTGPPGPPRVRLGRSATRSRIPSQNQHQEPSEELIQRWGRTAPHVHVRVHALPARPWHALARQSALRFLAAMDRVCARRVLLHTHTQLLGWGALAQWVSGDNITHTGTAATLPCIPSHPIPGKPGAL